MGETVILTKTQRAAGLTAVRVQPMMKKRWRWAVFVLSPWSFASQDGCGGHCKPHSGAEVANASAFLATEDDRLTTDFLCALPTSTVFPASAATCFWALWWMLAFRPKLLEDAVAALNVGARLEISRVMRGGIAATKVDVYAHGEKDCRARSFGSRRAGRRGQRIGTRSPMTTIPCSRASRRNTRAYIPHPRTRSAGTDRDSADHIGGGDFRRLEEDCDCNFRSTGRGRSRDSQYDDRQSPLS